MKLERTSLIIGVDPGQSTGAFLLDLYPTVDQLGSSYVIEAPNRYQGPPIEVLRALETELVAAQQNLVAVLIAVERFTVMPNVGRMSQQPVPLHVIGQLETLAERYDAAFLLQSPGDAKKFCTNAQLRQFNLWTTPKMVGRPDANDVNDAARHALLALAKTRTTAYDALLRSSIPTQRS